MNNKCYQTVSEAVKDAIKLSKANPKLYYTLYDCFGIFIAEHKRLNIFAPTDSFYKAYFKGGKEKLFTEAQRIADQNATPFMY